MRSFFKYLCVAILLIGHQVNSQDNEFLVASDIQAMIDRLSAIGGQVELPAAVIDIDRMLTLRLPVRKCFDSKLRKIWNRPYK